LKQADAEQLLREIDALLREGVDFVSPDSDTTVRNVKLLAGAAYYMNIALLEQYGGHPGEDRGRELVEQIVAAAFQSFGGEEAHPGTFEKASVIWRGIIQGHPFGDGNKRTGFALAAYLLQLSGYDPPTDAWNEDEVFEVNMEISAGVRRDIEDLTRQLIAWWGVELG